MSGAQVLTEGVQGEGMGSLPHSRAQPLPCLWGSCTKPPHSSLPTPQLAGDTLDRMPALGSLILQLSYSHSRTSVKNPPSDFSASECP